MPSDLSYMWIPLLACLVLTGMHAYLGIHVLSRGVIFVDLALAQIAALGSVVALWLGLEPGTPGAYGFALSFTMVGAFVFSITRMRDAKIPQEAIIGIVYAVASAAVVVVMSKTEDAHGVEKIRAILVGRSIVWITAGTVAKTAAIYSAIAVLHYVFRREFLMMSTDVERARREGLNIGFWDFLFYATFGFVITSSVQIGGVLLVFSYLIVPAVIGALLSENVRTRLIIGWASGLVASVIGLRLSFDLPSGPVIIVTFGALLLVTAAVRAIVTAEHPARIAVRVAGIAALFAAFVLAIVLPPWHHLGETHASDGDPRAAAPLAQRIRTGLASEDASQREGALAAAGSHPELRLVEPLHAAFVHEKEPDIKIHMAEEGLRLHDPRFLTGLVEFILSKPALFYRQEAAHLLARYTDLDLPDEIGDAELEVIENWWKSAANRLAWDEAQHRFTHRG